MLRSKRVVIWVCWVACGTLGLSGCGVSRASQPDPSALIPSGPGVEEEVELARLMGEAQLHSAKLGYSIEGRNLPLAQFYLRELEEVFGEVFALEEHDEMPIGDPAVVIMQPLLIDLQERMAAADWPQTEASYTSLIAGCNRCHTATEHQYIEIFPATGPAPFNQRFAAKTDTAD